MQNQRQEDDNENDLKDVARRLSAIVKEKVDSSQSDDRKASFGVLKKRQWYRLTTLRSKPKAFIARAILTRVVFFFHCAAATITLSHIIDCGQLYIPLGVYGVLTMIELTTAMMKGHLSQWKWCCTSTLVYAFYVIALVFIVETGLFQFRLQNGGDYCVTSFAACAASDDVSFPTNGTYKYNTIATGSRTHQQTLVFLLIVGRWLLPKDNFSRESLAQLLLVLIGSGEDIVEFVSENLTFPEIGCSKVTTVLVLILWGISLQQFSVALPQRKHKPDLDFDPEKKVVDKWISTVNRLLESRRSTIGNLSLHVESVVNENEQAKFSRKGRANSLHDKLSLKHVLMESTEVREALVTVVLQDGPFLCFRIYVLSLGYSTVLFYACKNLLVILLHAYRIYAMMVGVRRRGRIRGLGSPVATSGGTGPNIGRPKLKKKRNSEMIEISRVRAFSIFEHDEDELENEDANQDLVLKESVPNNFPLKDRKLSVRFETFSNPINDLEMTETGEDMNQ